MESIVSGLLSFFQLFWRPVAGAWRLMTRAKLTFGCPVQTAKEPDISWWHVPVTFRPGWLGIPRELPESQAFVRVYDDPLSRHAIRLYWKDIEPPGGRATADLRPDRVYLIAVAYREEGVSRDAFLSDREFFRSQGNERTYALRPKSGKYKIRLSVRSGRINAQSGFYIIRNHDIDSNGHFTLEAEYEGLGMEAFV